jgi:hypothetical protein
MEVEYTNSNNSNNESKKLDNGPDSQDISNSQDSSNSPNNINNIIENNIISEVTINSNKNVKYDHIKKMEIKKRIEKIKKKEYLIDIFKIITSSTRDYSENNNGVFIFFHDLSDETYEKVEIYVNNIYRLHRTTTNSSNIFNSEISESINDNSEKDNDKNLTNKEKMILRRKKYEEYLTHNQN